MDKFREGKVRVGWWGNITYKKGGPSVAQVARWNEFGTPYIPARPFFRPVVHGQRTELVQELRRMYQDALRNNKDTLAVLNLFGEDVEGRIRVSIGNVWTPPNAPITIYGGWLRRKGHKPVYIEGKGEGKKPLQNTLVLKDSVSHEVEEVMK
ncbi:MAG: hypothetical protein IIZ94_04695 [Prevotella sp.]|nr:hypothetical protein [Prevotella sp.]